MRSWTSIATVTGCIACMTLGCVHDDRAALHGPAWVSIGAVVLLIEQPQPADRGTVRTTVHLLASNTDTPIWSGRGWLRFERRDEFGAVRSTWRLSVLDPAAERVRTVLGPGYDIELGAPLNDDLHGTTLTCAYEYGMDMVVSSPIDSPW